MIVYYAGRIRPEPVECDGMDAEYDAKGRRVFENSHFIREENAWKQLTEEHKARVSLDADRVRQARQSLMEAEGRLLTSTLEREQCEREFGMWCRDQRSKT